MQALRDRSITDCSSERENSETSHELEENLTDKDDHTVASSAKVADHRWWCPSPDALDSLSTHSSLNEFDRNYGIRSELPDFVRARGFRESDQPEQIGTFLLTSFGSAKSVLITGYRMTRFTEESETQGLLSDSPIPNLCE
uniref:Uncharacterized protein LOC111102352 isoform X2 n=1 Tax=Crassostrea virginica TaxID=6565 RepID=A0A8B8AHT2_CRAVI|nr:uncharacterized protein LOC111102352 isoform X2 [Crassostrea virginica]